MVAIVALGVIVSHLRLASAPRRPVPAAVAPKDRPPPVEPTRFEAIAPADARAVNASLPLARASGPAAEPFRPIVGAENAQRAQDCLAAAAFYEAGNSEEGERAVAQVVLNRVHHPAFPKTVCGVVFQGSERSTGCQFTFTCDGTMARRVPSPAAWLRARAVAGAALGGAVYAPVGLATHYHADWVVPYWSARLDKIAQVGPHIFYRWAGWWGTADAFHGRESGPEPAVAVLGGQSDPGGSIAKKVLANGTVAVSGAINPGRSTDSDPDLFLIRLTGGRSGYGLLAQRLCASRERCTVLGWTDPRQVAQSLPLTLQQKDALAFRYVRDGNDAPDDSLREHDAPHVMSPTDDAPVTSGTSG